MTQQNVEDIKVWDLALRIFHWSLVSSFLIAFFTEDEWMSVHIWCGYLAFGLIIFRLIWGIIGPQSARFTDFVRNPKTVLQYTLEVLRGTARRYLGHKDRKSVV